jgi:hypothetical protein
VNFYLMHGRSLEPYKGIKDIQERSVLSPELWVRVSSLAAEDHRGGTETAEEDYLPLACMYS